MGQQDVLNHLKELRQNFGDVFFPASTIIKDLEAKGLTNGSLRRVRFNLVKLETFGFIEAKINSERGNWRREWRIKKKYM